jgi:hypothetical protein
LTIHPSRAAAGAVWRTCRRFEVYGSQLRDRRRIRRRNPVSRASCACIRLGRRIRKQQCVRRTDVELLVVSRLTRRVITGRKAATFPDPDWRHLWEDRLVNLTSRTTCLCIRPHHPTPMDKFQPDASDRPRSEVPANPRFTTQAATAEDLLKAQTVGLVNLNDYRKRRAEALDLKERGSTSGADSGASTPVAEYEKSCACLESHANLQSTVHQVLNLSSRRSAR